MIDFVNSISISKMTGEGVYFSVREISTDYDSKSVYCTAQNTLHKMQL